MTSWNIPMRMMWCKGGSFKIHTMTVHKIIKENVLDRCTKKNNLKYIQKTKSCKYLKTLIFQAHL